MANCNFISEFLEPYVKVIDFRCDNKGRIFCEECGIQCVWCGHLTYIAAHGIDAQFIWNKEPDSEYIEFIDLNIPIFPTRSLWTSVTLEWCGKPDLPRYRVWWRPEVQATETTPFHICYIAPGEGRQAIRTTLIDSMWGDVNRPNKCMATHHNVLAELAWSQIMKGPDNAKQVELWSIYNTRQCMYCNSTGSDGSDPDLIPDRESTW